MPDELRRVRTQAERDADDHTWRHAAGTRPGYATYPGTAPGSPSWWLRGGPEIHHHPPARPPHLGPPPVDGETCTKWCGFCHLNTGDKPEPPERPPADRSWIEMEHAPPRRRWWHRYTRRNP